MKKNLIMLVTSLFVSTTLLSPFTAFSDEKKNHCENMSFTVQTFTEDSEVIQGNVEPESEIMLEVVDYREAAIADDNGGFEFKLEEDEFESGTDIILTNNQHIIETKVKEEDFNVQTIYSKLDGECIVFEALLEESKEENVDNQPVEEQAVTEETSDEIPTEENRSHDEETSDQNENQKERNKQSKISLSSTADGRTETVHNWKEFTNAIVNPDVEVVELNNNITASGETNRILIAESNSDKKVIDGQGFNIKLGIKSITLEESIKVMEIRNASFETMSTDGFFITGGHSVEFNFRDVFFNPEYNVGTNLGVLGHNPESTAHFYGQNEVHPHSYQNQYGINFGKVVIHDGASLLLHYHGMGAAIKFDESVRDQDYGIEVGKDASLDVISEDEIIVSDAASPLSFKSDTGAKIKFEGDSDNGIIQLNQNEPAEFNIYEPETIDFTNQSNNRLFNEKAIVDFNIRGASVHGWKGQDYNEALPSHKTEVLSEGIFRFNGNATSIIENLIPDYNNFENDFPPTMPRLMFSEVKSHTLDLLVNDIMEDDLVISGTASPGVTVTMYDEADEIIADTVSDESGDFSFEWNQERELGPGLILKFQSRLQDGDNESRVVEKTVVANRLEMKIPEEMPFGTHEISQGMDLLNREEEEWEMSVFDNRENGSWELRAQVNEPLRNESGQALDNAMVYLDDGDRKSLEEGEVPIASSAELEEGNDTKTITWENDEGILIEVNLAQIVPNTEYSTEIEWSLIDGPQ